MNDVNTTHIFVAALVSILAACSNDPQSCSLDPASGDPGIAACATSEDATCVVETHPQCGGESCVQWRGEDGFCTIGCSTDNDCGPDERCVEIVLASGAGHCVPGRLVD